MRVPSSHSRPQSLSMKTYMMSREKILIYSNFWVVISLILLFLIALCVIADFAEAQRAAAISQEAQEVLERVNYYRELAGLPFVQYNYEQEQGCQNHANYLALNPDDFGHDEDPTRPGYTELGLGCGMRSIIAATEEPARIQ